MKKQPAEKLLFFFIAIFTVVLFLIGVAILVGTIILYNIMNHTMNSIITILFIIVAVITGFCIFGLFCIRRKPMACLLYMISLGITSTAFIAFGAVMFLGKEMLIKALISSLTDSKEAIELIEKKINENIDTAKIVLLIVPVVPLLLLLLTYFYRKICKQNVDNNEM